MKSEMDYEHTFCTSRLLSANEFDYEILPHAEAFTAGMAAAAEDIAHHHQAKGVMVSSQRGSS